eukprot:3041680-Pleurochrysis_carterae.AAC.3
MRHERDVHYHQHAHALVHARARACDAYPAFAACVAPLSLPAALRAGRSLLFNDAAAGSSTPLVCSNAPSRPPRVLRLAAGALRRRGGAAERRVRAAALDRRAVAEPQVALLARDVRAGGARTVVRTRAIARAQTHARTRARTHARAARTRAARGTRAHIHARTQVHARCARRTHLRAHTHTRGLSRVVRPFASLSRTEAQQRTDACLGALLRTRTRAAHACAHALTPDLRAVVSDALDAQRARRCTQRACAHRLADGFTSKQ